MSPQRPVRINYQEDLDLDFGRAIASAAGGENLYRCIQCGTCSSTCPLSIYMDYTPRKVIAMTRAGFKEDVLRSSTIWLCASCYACTVECPREVRLTDIMYALKRCAIEQKAYPRRLPIPVLAREFIEAIYSAGRSNEARLVMRVLLKTAPLKLFRQLVLGFRLLRRGRLSFRKDSLAAEAQRQVCRLLDHVEAARRQIAVPTGT